MIEADFLSAATSALAQFWGYFNNYYAPANRTTFLSVSSLYQNTAFVYTSNASQSVEITRAASSARGRTTKQVLIGSAHLLRE
jgi:hypothetical protein